MPDDKGNPIHIRMRQHIGWRIPIMLLDELDAVRGKRKRTDCVVEALERWVRAERRKAVSK